jgi:hypothetical protein
MLKSNQMIERWEWRDIEWHVNFMRMAKSEQHLFFAR